MWWVDLGFGLRQGYDGIDGGGMEWFSGMGVGTRIGSEIQVFNNGERRGSVAGDRSWDQERAGNQTFWQW